MNQHRRVVVSDEAVAMMEGAKCLLIKSDGHTPTLREALDWLLRDACEYGSAIVGSWARKTWPESAETKNWRRRHGMDGQTPLGPGAEVCQGCGSRYSTVYQLPDDVWAAITPKPDQPRAGLLCPPCADSRAEAAGLTLVWTAEVMR